MKNLITRSITGTVFVILIVASILWHPYAFEALFLIVTLLGLMEFYSLVENGEARPQYYTGFLLAAVFYAFAIPEMMMILKIFSSEPNLWFLIYYDVLLCLPVILATILLVELFRKSPKPVTNISHTIMGLTYVVLPFCMLVSIISKTSYGIDTQLLVLGFFVLVWANDTGAYAVGSLIGRTKLFERVSPNKTWEGTLGGVLISLGVAYLISVWNHDLLLYQWLILGAICSVFSTLGDLAQSRIKRSYGVKDSGNILPGHGGILDRFDGVLLAAPVFYVYCKLSLLTI